MPGLGGFPVELLISGYLNARNATRLDATAGGIARDRGNGRGKMGVRVRDAEGKQACGGICLYDLLGPVHYDSLSQALAPVWDHYEATVEQSCGASFRQLWLER